jgi:metallo-beta-lactamase family protein
MGPRERGQIGVGRGQRATLARREVFRRVEGERGSDAPASGHRPVGIARPEGMGRILHHLARRLPDPRTTVLVAGFQAAGTRGRTLLDGAKELRIHGRDVSVAAAVRRIDALSGHADRRELDRWLGALPAPRRTFLVHGEPAAARGMAEMLRASRGWATHVPALGETVELET